MRLSCGSVPPTGWPGEPRTMVAMTDPDRRAAFVAMTKALITDFRANGGQVVGVAMVVDRSNGAVNFGLPLLSLIALNVETFEPTKLPPNLAKIPAVKPGSK